MGEQTGSLPDISVKIYPTQDAGNLRAFASVTLGGCFAVNNIRVMEGEKGVFAAMPSNKGKDGAYHDICFPVTKEMRQALNSAILGEYQRETEKTSVRGSLKEAAEKSAAQPAQDTKKQDRGAR